MFEIKYLALDKINFMRYNYSVDILNEKNIKTQNIKGTSYVYKDTSYWDKEKKQNRHIT